MKAARRFGTMTLVAALVLAAATPAAADPDMIKAMHLLDGFTKAGRMREVAEVLGAFGQMRFKEYPEWAPIAQKGAAAAKKNDAAGVRQSCTSCHEKYKDAWREKSEKR